MDKILFLSFLCFNADAYSIMYQPSFVKKTVFFYPAKLKNNIPYEMYHTFLDTLKESYTVEIMEENMCPISENMDEYLLLSHSSGANELMNTYESLPENVSKKAILIDPLDFQKYTLSFPTNVRIPSWKLELDMDNLDDMLHSYFERDYINEVVSFLTSKIKQVQEDKHEKKGNILLLNHKQSKKWRLFPLIPPIHYLKKDLGG